MFLKPHSRAVHLFEVDGLGRQTKLGTYYTLSEVAKKYNIRIQKITEALDKGNGKIKNSNYFVKDISNEERIEIYKKQGVM